VDGAEEAGPAAVAARVLVRILGLESEPGFELAEAGSPRLRELGRALRGARPPRFPTLFESFCRIVPYQQVSLDSGTAVVGRFVARFGRRVGDLYAFPEPGEVAAAPAGAFAGIGLSRTKVATLQHVARLVQGGELGEEELERLPSPAAMKGSTRCRDRPVERGAGAAARAARPGRVPGGRRRGPARPASAARRGGLGRRRARGADGRAARGALLLRPGRPAPGAGPHPAGVAEGLGPEGGPEASDAPNRGHEVAESPPCASLDGIKPARPPPWGWPSRSPLASPRGAPPVQRRAGPENVEGCPGARWTGQVATYDLAASEAVLRWTSRPPPGAGRRRLAPHGLLRPPSRRCSRRPPTKGRAGPRSAAMRSSAGPRTPAATASWASPPGTARASSRSASATRSLSAWRGGASGWSCAPPGRAPGRPGGRGSRSSPRPAAASTPAGARAATTATARPCRTATRRGGDARCPTSVGSQAHDSCCSRWGGGAYVCGRLRQRAQRPGEPRRCLVTDPPPGLEPRLRRGPPASSPAATSPAAPNGTWPSATSPRPLEALDLRLDPLEITWRPTEIARLVSVRGKPAAVPSPGVALPGRGPGEDRRRRAGLVRLGPVERGGAGVARCE
jgi:hypothetical protein